MRRTIAALFVILALVAAACSGSTDTTSDTEPEQGQLCVLEPPRDVDFSVLDDIVGIIQARSYFYDGTQSLETAYFGAFQAVYAFVGLSQNDIPADVQKTIMEYAEAGIVDFSILTADVMRLSQDSRYGQLARPEQQSEIFSAAANGVIKALGDPFGNYTPPESVFARSQSSTGQYAGFGFGFERTDQNEFKITSINTGNPADEAGLEAGDIVLEIDGKSLENCSQRGFSQALRGEAGETTIFTVRHLDGTVEDLHITRDIVTLNSVVSWPAVEWENDRGRSDDHLQFKAPMRDRDGNAVEGVLYIGFWQFQPTACIDLGYVLRTVPQSMYVNGIIIDLRGNPGGALNCAQQFLDYFTTGDIVTHVEVTRDGQQQSFRLGSQNPYRVSDRFDYATDVPLVVLIGPDTYGREGASDNSYSASEFVSGALKDHDRATIIGNRSGGKGLIGNTFDLDDGGQLTLEVREFRTPNGDVIQGEDLNGDGLLDTNGIEPHIVVEWTDDDYNKANRNPNWDPALFEAIDHLLGR